MGKNQTDAAKRRAIQKSEQYLHFPIRIFSKCNEPNIYNQAKISAAFCLAESLSNSNSERLGDHQLRHIFSADPTTLPAWCDSENDEHFFLHRASVVLGFRFSDDNFDFEKQKITHDKIAEGSRLVSMHKTVFFGFKQDTRQNSMFDFRIYSAIKAILGRDKMYRYIPSLWLRYGYWGGTARDQEFKDDLPTKQKTLKSIARLEKRGLISKFTDHNKSYFSVKLKSNEIFDRVAEAQAGKELKIEKIKSRDALRAKREEYKAKLLAAEAANACNAQTDETTRTNGGPNLRRW